MDRMKARGETLEDWDREIFNTVAGWHSPILDRTMPGLSVGASKSRIWMGIAAVLAVFGGKKGRLTAAEGMISIGITSFLTNVVLKGAVHRVRPVDEVPEERSIMQPESSSFPSGHSASAAAFSGIVGKAYPALWLPINGLAATVGFSRVYTGVHYPGDVFIGWFVGRSVAFGVNHVARHFGLAQKQVD